MPREVPLIHPGTVLLEHVDFTIGREFWTETGRLRCTDIGTRTICAIKLDGRLPQAAHGSCLQVACAQWAPDF